MAVTIFCFTHHILSLLSCSLYISTKNYIVLYVVVPKQIWQRIFIASSVHVCRSSFKMYKIYIIYMNMLLNVINAVIIKNCSTKKKLSFRPFPVRSRWTTCAYLEYTTVQYCLLLRSCDSSISRTRRIYKMALSHFPHGISVFFLSQKEKSTGRRLCQRSADLFSQANNPRKP